MNLSGIAPYVIGSTLGMSAPLGGTIQPPQASMSVPFGGGSGYDAANYSTRRGYVYFPTLNTQREVQPWSRLEMSRRSRYLTRNVGFAKRCTYGLAQMVGSLHPRPFTDDKDWNKLALSAYERRAERPLTFDRAGRYTAWSIQPVITRSRMIDGDFGAVLTSSQSGGAMCAFYESHQIGNGLQVFDEQWRDGVRIIGERATQYRLLDPADANKTVDIAAQDFILNADFLSIGHSRGVTALHHAITNMLDTTEIRSDVKLGIKIANRVGIYIGRSQPKGSAEPRGMGGGSPQTITTPAGDDILSENLWKGGKIIDPGVGAEIKTLLDQRPHPNSREFLEDLNRDIAWGVGISPDVLWNIAKLGGASVRYVLADAQVWIEAQQQLLVDQFLHRFWVYFISKEIKSGRLRPPTDPDWFWKVGFQPPAKLTVDIKNDGRLSIDLHRAGMLTLKRWYGSQGLDEEEEIRQHVREYALKVKIIAEVEAETGVKIDYDRVFPPAPGQAPAGNIIDPTASDPNFSDPQNIQSVLVDIRDHLATLRAA